MKYIIYIEPDPSPDPQRYPDGKAWRSGVLLDHEEHGTEEIDSEGDLPDYETARDLALNTLTSITKNPYSKTY